MRDIYLIDFENVASEGLSGITYLSEDDQVIIFYSNNSNRLTMKMHILIGKSVCKLNYFEVTVGGKNALDHQISTWLGYLVGTGAADRNYYIVSRDMGYKHVANFWAANGNAPRVRCVDTIKAAGRLERNRREAKEPVLQAVPVGQPTAEEAVPVSEQVVSLQPVAAEPKPVETEPAVQETEVTAEGTVEAAEAEEAIEAVPAEAEEAAEAAPAEAEEAVEAVPAEAEEAVEAVPAEKPAAQTLEPSVEAAVLPEAVAKIAQGADEAVQEAAESEEAAVRKNHRNRARARRSHSRSRVQPQEKEAAVQEVQTVEARSVAETASAEPEVKQEKKKPAAQKNTQTREKAAENPKPGSSDQLSVLIAPYPKLQESVLRELIANNKRQILCNTLRKHLGQEKGLALYNEIKRVAWH